MSSPESQFIIKPGQLIRRAMTRQPDSLETIAYMDKLAAENIGEANDDAEKPCPFCPEKLLANNKLIEAIGSRSYQIYVIEASAPYDSWDALKVLRHHLILPEEHIEDEHDLPIEAVRTIRDYLYERRKATPPGVIAQDYTRAPGNTSKSVGHLHKHLFDLSNLDPLIEFSYNSHDGVTKSNFMHLTTQQQQTLLGNNDNLG